MGLFDGLAQNLMGQAIQGFEGGHPALAPILEMVQNQPGGIAGLAQKFQEGGLGEVAQSWISNGQNLPISADQIQSVLGSGQVAELAEKLGVSPETASSHLAEFLPQIVNHLTPNGEAPAQGDLLSMGESLLGSFLSKG